MENENQIYDKDLLYSRIIRIKEMKPTWPSFVEWFHKFVLENKRDYSTNQRGETIFINIGK